MAKRLNKRFMAKSHAVPNESAQVNPKSYFEQLEPRLVLGSCLALGGAEALLSNAAEAAERNNPAVLAPPAEMLNPKTINSQPTDEIPTLFSWKPSLSDINEFAKKDFLNKQPSKNWLNKSPDGANISGKLGAAPKAANKFRTQTGNGGYQNFASPLAQAAAPAKPLFSVSNAAAPPQLMIQPLGSNNFNSPGSNGPGSIVVNTGTDSMILRATGPLQALSGSEYSLSLSASGPGSNAITNWTINWGDGTVEEIEGNPDQASHVYDQEGAYIIKTSVSNGEKTWSASTVPVQVVEAVKPAFTSNPPTDAGAGDFWQYKAKAVRPDGGDVSYALVSGPEGLAIDSSSGLLSWTPGIEYVGQHTIVIEAIGEQGKSVQQEFLLKVHEELQSRPPQIVAGPPVNIPAESDYSFQVEAWDPDGNVLSFSLANAPAGMAISQDGLITWLPPREMHGQAFKITLIVDDGQGGIATRDFNMVVGDYQPPILTSSPSQYAVVGKEYSYQIKAESPVGAELSYTIAQGPAGMSIDPATGLLSYTPTTEGKQTVQIQVSDGQGIESQTFTLMMVVNPLPQIVSTPNQYASLGQEYVYQAEVINPSAMPISWYLESPVQGMSISESTGQLLFKPAFAGSVAVTIIARDYMGKEARQNFQILVRDPAVNQAPVIHSQMRSTVTVGVNYIHQILASDPNGDPLTYSLIDGPAGAFVAENGQFTWSPTSDQLGQHSIVTRVADDLGSFTDAAYDVTVTMEHQNQVPAFTSSPPTLAAVNNGWTYRAQAIDPDNDSVYFIVEEGPSGMTVDHVSGFFRWQPTIDQLGEHKVTVGVIDGYGAWTTQTFTITVQAVNTSPRITSTPTTIGQIGNTWTYQAQAVDGEGDDYTFHLGGNAPPCMQIDAKTGLIAFTPDAPGEYLVNLFVTDVNGDVSSQQFVLLIKGQADNLPPQINSNPNFYAAVGKEYSYQIQAIDPDGDALSYSLRTAPDGMSIDLSGRLTWAPSSNFLGEHRVEIIVSDGQNTAMQSFLLRVAYNAAPSFDKIPKQTVTDGTEFILNAQAKDPNKDVLFYEIVNGPDGLTIDENGLLRWQTATKNAGFSSQIEIRAVDPFGEEARVSFTIEVVSDAVPPEVSLTSSAQPANVGDAVSFYVKASDNIGVAGMSLTVDGRDVALDAGGLATAVFSTVGEHIIIAKAWDEAGNISQKELVLRVANPADRKAPVISWNIANKAVIKDLTDIKGSINDESGVTWKLSLSHVDSDKAQIFASGEKNISNALLGTIDPSMWPNGSYILGLEAVDSNGNTSKLGVIITISSQYKMGNFNLGFDDLTINVGGIPITIKRTYDTLKANVNGDFGYGWSMSYIPVSLRNDTAFDFNGDPFYGLFSNDTAFRNGTKITVNLPNGKNAVFRVNAYKPNRFLPYYTISFVDESGSGATLNLDRNVSLKMDYSGYLTDTVGAYFNPASEWTPANYALTMVDGSKFTINGRTGQCTQATDVNGNRVDLSGNSIKSYSGSTLLGEATFQRDSKGRITAISDANGVQLTYEYDQNGDLVAVNKVNSPSGSVNLHYVDDPKAPPHYLKSITDVRGVEQIGIQYDFANGRISGITGPDGSSSSVSFTKVVGPGLNVETVTDPLGRMTETVVDKDGNAVRLIQYIPDGSDPGDLSKMTYQITINEYDAKGNCLGSSRPFQVTEAQLRAANKNQYDYRPADLFWETKATYDAKNNQLTSTDAYGKITKYTYDAKGNLKTTTDPFGLVSTNVYDSLGRMTETKTPNGVRSVYEYYPNSALVKSIKQILPDGTSQIQSTMEYTSGGQISKMTDANGNVTINGYDAKGRQIFSKTNTIDPQNSSIVHVVANYTEYDVAGNASQTWREVNGIEASRTVSTYDSVGKLLTSTDRYGLTTHYFYDINDRVIETRRQVSNSNGQFSFMVKRTVYDAAGQVVWEQAEHLENDPANSPQAAPATYTIYDSLGRAVRTETRGDVVIGLSGSGLNLTCTVLGTGQLIDYNAQGYNNAGQAAWGDSGNGLKTVYYYTPQGALSHTAIDMDGDLSTLADQIVTSQTIYDEYGRQTGKITDADGNLSTTGDQSKITYVYDNYGRVVKTIMADGSFTAAAYDVLGQKVSETDQQGRITYYEYDLKGRLTAVILPQIKHPVSGLMVHVRYEYGYNAEGRQSSLRDNIFQTAPLNASTINRTGQRETTFEYDWQGRQVSRTLPDGSSEYFTYDAQGRQSRHVSFEGRVTDFEYDAYGRQARKIFYNNQTECDQNLAAKIISYTYDLSGRLIKEVDTANGATTNTYDQNGRIIRVSSPQGAINYEYAHNSGQITRTWTGTNSASPITDVRNSYDIFGRLETVSTYAREGAALSTPETAQYVYDLVGTLDKIIQANGVIADYNYDNLNRLKELTHYAPDATPENLSNNPVLQRYTYSYLKDGNKSRETFTDAQGKTHTWDWVYDQLGRLTKEVHDNADNSQDYTTEYVYDLVGNRLEKRVDKNNDGTIDQVIQGTFDQNDRMVSETEKVNGQAARRTDYVFNKTEQIAKTIIDLINSRTESKTTMVYNAQGRLSKITIDTFTNAVKSQSVVQEYTYDSKGIKIKQVESIDSNADGTIDGQSITNYLNEALNHTGYSQVLEERRVENGQPVKVTTYTIGHDVLAQFDAINGYLALMADGHGSTRGVSNSLGQVVQQYSYDAYGNAVGFDPALAKTNLLYSGEQFNPVSGLQYLRARWYNPQSGIFNRLDPYAGNKMSPLSFHNYAYGHMNPISNTDPSGLFIAGLSDLILTMYVRAATVAFNYAPIFNMMTNMIFVSFVSSAVYKALAEVGVMPHSVAADTIFNLSLFGVTTIGGAYFGPAKYKSQFKETSSLFQPGNNARIITGSAANRAVLATNPTYKPPYVPHSVATQGTLKSGTDFVRVYTSGTTDPKGAWIMPKSDVKGLSPAQIQQKYSLPNLPTHYVTVKADGLQARVGYAAENFNGSAGALQIELLNENFADFIKSTPIGGGIQ